MGLFSKKTMLEDFVSTTIRTAFEYPFDKNIKRVDTNSLLSDRELKNIKEHVPSFIIAVNTMLIMLAAEQGAIKRFKGDSNYEISKTLGYAMAVTTGNYLEYKGLSNEQAANDSEAVCNEAFEYLEVAESKLGDSPKIDDIFFEFCKYFQNQTLGLNSASASNRDKKFMVFDFAKQLYRNVQLGFGSIKIE